MMWLLMPWMKYFWNANPWVYDLDERYVQQISTTMKDCANMQNSSVVLNSEKFQKEKAARDEEMKKKPEDWTNLEDVANPAWVDHGICDTARRVISRSKQFAFVRKQEDLWNFAPHYPYPPDDRRWAIGMQVCHACYAAVSNHCGCTGWRVGVKPYQVHVVGARHPRYR